ncbi:universal stress protein [Halodesulfovibrio aestuarii]|uniref:Universal stress protein n=1 Tax=Halodesulfovibrio aestuarii TaxID=126333 RepID=A0A8G2C9Y3_9BACT|nr:universal stress protein [Halodesulfovibrio aestuarii]SHJ05063.1 Universal stress protein family protein [Halodesulfovibrio aestuarii]
MESILVAIDGKHGAWGALSRACALAKRMDVKLNVLLVVPPVERALSRAEQQVEEDVRVRLGLNIEAAKSEGICINYFLAEGSYDNEVIEFINNNKISLLVHEIPEEDARSPERYYSTLHSIRHRVSCRVEILVPKKGV